MVLSFVIAGLDRVTYADWPKRNSRMGARVKPAHDE
jgi:hypothetical protein